MPIQSLEFNSHEALVKMNISIINDELIENDETFNIYFTSGDGVIFFPYAQTNVTIMDDDNRKGNIVLV